MQAYTTNKSQPKLHHLCWCLNPIHFSVFLCNTCRRTWSCNYYMLCKHKIISVHIISVHIISVHTAHDTTCSPHEYCGHCVDWMLYVYWISLLLVFANYILSIILLFNVLSLYCVLLIVPYMAISNRILTSFWSCSWKDVEGLLHIH